MATGQREISEDDFEEELKSLKVHTLDKSRCTSTTSLHQQIIASSHEIREHLEARQRQQFNLANGNSFSDPIEAASYLLKRECGHTHLFNDGAPQEAIFIPPVFVSDLSVLDDPVATIWRTSATLTRDEPQNWFTKELEHFLAPYKDVSFKKTEYDGWIKKIKILYLIRKQGPLKDETVAIPTTYDPPHMCTDAPCIFTDACHRYLQTTDEHHSFTVEFEKVYNKTDKKFKKWLDKLLEIPPSDSRLSWFFKLELSALSGADAERWMYNELKDCGNLIKDFVVLHSCRMSVDKLTGNKQSEFDYLLLSAERKLVISVEVKRSIYIRGKNLFLKKPFDQLRGNQDTLEERLGDRIDDQWTFVPVLAVVETHPSLDAFCQSIHVITKETEIEDWLLKIFERCPKNNETSSSSSTKEKKPLLSYTAKEQLQHLLEIMVFTLNMSKATSGMDFNGSITSTNWTDYISQAIKAVSTADNIIFYSNNQFPIMSGDPKYRVIMITGKYGTGKTFLLREKAEILAQNNEKVLFVIDSESMIVDKSLMQISLEERWKDPKYKGNIRVMNKQDIVNSHRGSTTNKDDPMTSYRDAMNRSRIMPEHLLTILKREEEEYVFIDEWDIGHIDEQREKMATMEKIANMQKKLVWIVLNRSLKVNYSKLGVKTLQWPYHPSKKYFRGVELEYSMRNSPAIIESANEMLTKEYMDFRLSLPPPLFPAGCQPVNVPSIEVALQKVRHFTKKGILFVVKTHYAKMLQTNHIESLIETVQRFCSNCTKTCVAAYFNNEELKSLPPNIVGIPIVSSKECLSYLNTDNSMLITSELTVQGFEWPTVIMYNCGVVPKPISPYNIGMRSISNLIVVVENQEPGNKLSLAVEDRL